MKAAVLADVMGNTMSLSQYKAVTGVFNKAMILSHVADQGVSKEAQIRRSACLIAQVREECIGLSVTQELGDDAYLRSRTYWPWIGRGWIQLTWESHYADYGVYCHNRGLISDPAMFTKNPAALADPKYAAWTIPYYWNQSHGWTWGTINNAADHNDIVDASHQVNGGDYGLQSRIDYYNYALTKGDAILPEGPISMWKLARLSKRVDALEKRMAAQEKTMATVRKNNGQRSARLAQLDTQLQSLDGRVSSVEKNPALKKG